MGKFKASLLVTIVVIVVVFLAIFQSLFVIIDAGEVGVVKTFGNVDNQSLKAGFHLKNPISEITRMNVRTSEYTMSRASNEGAVNGDDSIQAKASDGASIWLDVTVFYKLDENKAPEIYKNIGLDYESKIIRPKIRSTIREEAARYPVIEIYSIKRGDLVEGIRKTLQESLSARGIILEDVLLRDITLSQTLADSIEQKLAAQQEAEKFNFILDKEKKEADRKRIEAQGQRDAQKIISESLTSQYLYYIYIQSLKDTKGTIYVPTEGGVPLFKGI